MRLRTVTRRDAARREERRAASLTSLVDVVFLLLVFFLLAGSLRATAPFEIEPPEGRHGGEAERRRHVVWLSRAGEIAIDAEPVAAGALAARLSSLPKGAAIALRADAASRARDLLPVLETLEAAGVERVDLWVRDAP